MPLFTQDREVFRTHRFEMERLRSSIQKDFQRMVSLLDLAGQGKLPPNFQEWSEKLDSIDASLEKAFNRIGQISSGPSQGAPPRN
jgi:hypothetical protein